MLDGSIVKGLLAMAIPIMVMNILQSVFNIIDMTVLKIYDTDGGYSVGAVGACGTLISLINGLVIGVSSGANVVIARFIGKGNKEGVERSVGTALTFAFAAGLFLTVLGVSCAELFLGWMNCPPTLLEGAVLYFKLYYIGVPILMVYNFSASVLRSTGDTTRPMIFLTIGGIVKICATLLFVAVFKMTIVGVALATIVSWLSTAVLAIVALVRTKSDLKIKPNRLRFYKTELLGMLYIGIPAGLQQALYSVANVIITATVNSFGKDATTGISIANNFDGILYQISVATSLAVMPYVSQNVGAGNIKRAAQSVWKGILITVALGATFGALSAIFSGQLSSIMSDNPDVIAYSRQKMIIISSTYFICGINEIFCAALRGMGKPIIPTIATLIFMCGIRFIWVFAIFPFYRNLTFLYLIWPIGWILSIITLLFFYFPTVKELSLKAAAREDNTPREETFA